MTVPDWPVSHDLFCPGPLCIILEVPIFEPKAIRKGLRELARLCLCDSNQWLHGYKQQLHFVFHTTPSTGGSLNLASASPRLCPTPFVVLLCIERGWENEKWSSVRQREGVSSLALFLNVKLSAGQQAGASTNSHAPFTLFALPISFHEAEIRYLQLPLSLGDGTWSSLGQ